MKIEIPISEPVLDKVEVSAEQQQEKKLTYLGSLLPHNGHRCFEYNTKTGEIKEAVYAKQDIQYPTSTAKAGIKRRVIVNADCIYITALNQKNALKKVNQRLQH